MDRFGFDLEIKDLTFSYNKEINVFRNLNLSVRAGEIVSLFGTSGLGKSTLLKLISGLLIPKLGHIKIDGMPHKSISEGISYVSQNYSNSLFPWMNVSDNISLPIRKRKLEKTDQAQMVDEILESVGLGNIGKLFPWELSGGMQQRVAIARALIVSPRLLLLDEPFAALDIHTKSQLQDLILRQVESRNITTILVSHELEDAIYFSDKVVRLGNRPASVTEIYEVPLERPRNQVKSRAEIEFNQLRSQIFLDLEASLAATNED